MDGDADGISGSKEVAGSDMGSETSRMAGGEKTGMGKHLTLRPLPKRLAAV